MAELEFADRKGENLVKTPGSINGEGFVLRNLEDCSVFLLDYTSEVEVVNCSSCQIFIGPVDGPAIFDSCTNCQVSVACQQFNAKSCSACQFGLYCATQPVVSGSSAIRISCWSGAYPGLTQHFAAANLDPSSNHWNKVYDGSASEGAEPNFELVADQAPYWEVPLEGAGPPDNPVPGPDGSLYTAAAPALPAEAEDPFMAPAPAAAPVENGFGGAGANPEEFMAGGACQTAAGGGSAEPRPDNPTLVAAQERLQQRIAEQAREEASKKAEVQAAASRYLEEFYQRRSTTKEERIKQAREASAGNGPTETGPQGAGEWERVISMIDFNLTRPNGSDLSRFKSVLLSCKAHASGATA